MPIAPRIKSTIAALPIHITRISFFSVFGSFVIDSSSFGRARLRSPQATYPRPLWPIAFIYREPAGRGYCDLLHFCQGERQSSRLSCPGSRASSFVSTLACSASASLSRE
jgi:hypothetical protein